MRKQFLTCATRTTRLTKFRNQNPFRSFVFRNMSTTHQPAFSTNSDVTLLKQQLDPLLLEQGGRWTLTSEGKGIERAFKFKTFKKTWEFMNTVAAECAVKKHHPEWSNVYNTTFIRWTTHSPPGLSEKDIQMAQYCDEQALLNAEVESAETEVGKKLADRVAVEGGDCCVPKKKSS